MRFLITSVTEPFSSHHQRAQVQASEMPSSTPSLTPHAFRKWFASVSKALLSTGLGDKRCLLVGQSDSKPTDLNAHTHMHNEHMHMHACTRVRMHMHTHTHTSIPTTLGQRNHATWFKSFEVTHFPSQKNEMWAAFYLSTTQSNRTKKPMTRRIHTKACAHDGASHCHAWGTQDVEVPE
jgi:hypothetical protein